MKKIKCLKLYNFIVNLFTKNYEDKEPSDYEDLINF